MDLSQSIRAVVTGAGSGLGEAICLELATRKAKILVSDINLENAEKTAAMVREKGGEAKAVCCDVSSAKQVEALAIQAEKEWGGTDLLVNNAGVPVSGYIGDVPLENWKWIVDINLWGVIYGCHFFAPRMRAQGKGAILNVASVAGFAYPPRMAPYCVTKAGVFALSENLRRELEDDAITVSVLCPAYFRSNLMDNSRSTDPDATERGKKLVGEARWSAQQIARTALRGVERKKLHILPQPEARFIWRLKRLFPNFSYRILVWIRPEIKPPPRP